MNIIIVGCGKVGYALAEQLNDEGHEITIIDKNDAVIRTVTSTLDIIGVTGNGSSFRVQLEAGVDKADLLIAVTDKDEVNMLACLIAKKAGNCRTIARVRDPEYYEEINYIRDELGLSLSINPEWAAAYEIAKLIQVPSALELDSFAKGRVNLVKVKVPIDSVLDGIKLRDIPAKVGKDILVCIVERRHEVIIPDGSCVLQAGDAISIIMPLKNASQIYQKIGVSVKPIKNIMIAGGSTIAYYLAKILLNSKVRVKIIEKDSARCKQLSEILPKASIINGDATDKAVLLEEGIKKADAIASLTDLDEENILLSLYADKVSEAKIITKINKIAFEEVIGEMPVGSIICPKNLTAEQIIQYIRAKQNSFGSNVETMYKMVDNKVEALEFKVGAHSKVINIPLENLKLKDNLLLCCIFRNGTIKTPSGKDTIMPGDNVIVVTTHKGLKDIKDILREG
ncbi:MAG: Trk system potassium transporter TrkA [Lachnospiraceae bacterium]|nr:Trk system potassium transporter TrkA [Lachnospiraceae bacterium]